LFYYRFDLSVTCHNKIDYYNSNGTPISDIKGRLQIGNFNFNNSTAIHPRML